MDRRAWHTTVHETTESDMIERLNHLKAIKNDGLELPWQLSGYDSASIAAGVNSIHGQKTHTA